MKLTLISNHFFLTLAAGLAVSAIAVHAQDVVVNGSLTDVAEGGGVYDYTLTLSNTGTEAVNALWLGWFAFDFDIANPSNPGNSLGWASAVDGNSIQFGAGMPLASGASATFTFDSTSTPAQFMSTPPTGQSVAYGVNDTPFALHNTTLNSDEFTPTVVSAPEPSILGLLAVGSTGLLGSLRRKGYSQ
jgi:hypothetical protein